MAELGTRCTHRKGAGRKLSAYGCARRISTRRRRHAYKWIRRFVQEGLAGLHEHPRDDRRSEPRPPDLREQPNHLDVG